VALVEIDAPAAGVHRIRIADPDHRGALSAEVLDGLMDALVHVPAEARCLLLASRGEAFSAGYDLRAVGDAPGAGVDVDVEVAARTIAPDRVELFDALERQPCRSSPRSTGPRSAAAWSWRSPATCGSRRVGRRSGPRPAGSASSTRRVDSSGSRASSPRA
jgi:hypothetical protein